MHWRDSLGTGDCRTIWVACCSADLERNSGIVHSSPAAGRTAVAVKPAEQQIGGLSHSLNLGEWKKKAPSEARRSSYCQQYWASQKALADRRRLATRRTALRRVKSSAANNEQSDAITVSQVRPQRKDSVHIYAAIARSSPRQRFPGKLCAAPLWVNRAQYAKVTRRRSLELINGCTCDRQEYCAVRCGPCGAGWLLADRLRKLEVGDPSLLE